MTPEELQELNDLISPLVLKGQPLSHIFAVHKDEIPVCRRTLYNYFDQCVFKARNIDLPRRVRYKKRKKRSEPRKKDYQQTYRNKRTYIDFERFMEAHPDTDVVEMDTVKGSREKGKCLLTLLFRSCSFMIIILLPDCTQKASSRRSMTFVRPLESGPLRNTFRLFSQITALNLRIPGKSRKTKPAHTELMCFTAILMFPTRRGGLKRIMNIYVISSQKVGACINTLRKI